MAPLPEFLRWSAPLLRRGEKGSLANGVLYFKGTLWREKLAGAKAQPATVWPLYEFVPREYFAEKFLLHFAGPQRQSGSRTRLGPFEVINPGRSQTCPTRRNDVEPSGWMRRNSASPMAMDDYWQRYHGAIAGALKGLATTTANHEALDPEQAFVRLCEWTQEVRAADGTIHFAGNGASACMASHMALDWTKNGGVRATAHNDPALLTAIGNDLGNDRVFAAPLQWYARPGDLLATISSSGNSPNIVRAIAAAHEKGLRVVTFSGMKPDNNSRAAGDLNFYISAWSYGIVECSHQVLLHAWLDRFMDMREGQMTKPQFT